MKKTIYLIFVTLCACLFFMTSCGKKTEDPIVLNPVAEISDIVNDNVIKILWQKPTSGTPTAYKLYRNDVHIKTLTETSFTETVSEVGLYNYCVSVVYEKGESEKVCVSVEVEKIPEEDYAEMIAGSYLGEIYIPMTNETFDSVVISLNYKDLNIVTVAMNDSITPMDFTVPLYLDEDVTVLKSESSYVFSFETTTNMVFMGQDLQIPLVGEGTITGEVFVLNISLTVGATNVEGSYTGVKQ